MAQLQLPRNETNIYKKKRVYRTCNSYFMHLKCKDCGETTVCFSHSQTDIKCPVCSTLILRATGGKARLVPGVAFKIAENQY